MTGYSRQIYNPRGHAYPSGENDDGGGGGNGSGDSEVTPSYQPRKRRFRRSYR